MADTDIPDEWEDRAFQAIANAFEGQGEAWSDPDSGDRLAHIAARAATRAVAARVRADTLREAADAYENYHGQLRVAEWLRQRARHA